MENLLTDIYQLKKKYGENIDKINFISFYFQENKDITSIKYETINNRFHEYIIDCEKLSDLILLPIDTKIYVCEGSKFKWTFYGDVITFALIKPKSTYIIETCALMGGGYSMMSRYIIDRRDKIKFVTKRKIDLSHVTFKTVLRINDRQI